MWCGVVVGGCRPLCGQVIFLLLTAAIAAPHDGTAEGCKVYRLLENATPLVYPLGEEGLNMGVHNSSFSSDSNLSGLTLEIKTVQDWLRATFNDTHLMVQSSNKSQPTCHGQLYHESCDNNKCLLKLWWNTFIQVKKNKLFINNDVVCRDTELHGTNLNLTVQSNNGSKLIVFNCKEGCPTWDDAAIITQEDLSKHNVFVKNTSENATAMLRPYNSYNSSNITRDVELTASAISEHWDHLLFKIKEVNINDITQNITMLTVGHMMDISTEMPHDTMLKVVNSTNMLWAVHCDPREQEKVYPPTVGRSSAERTTKDESACVSDHWKSIAVTFILMFFILLSVVTGLLICRHLKKWRKLLGDNVSHFFLDKSEHSVTSHAIEPQHSSDTSHAIEPQHYYDTSHAIQLQRSSGTSHTIQLQCSQKSCSSTALPTNSNSVHNDHNVIISMSPKNEEEELPKMFPPPPSSPPPPPEETQDLIFHKSLESLNGPVQEPNVENNDDEHDYDYLDMNLLKQQLEKDKEEETKMEEERKFEEKIELRRYNSLNSLYETLSTMNAGGTSFKENWKTFWKKRKLGKQKKINT